MALTIILISAVEQKRQVDPDSPAVTVGYKVMASAIDDAKPEIILGTEKVFVLQDTAPNMRTQLKDDLRPWWILIKEKYDREELVKTHAQTAIDELLAE